MIDWICLEAWARDMFEDANMYGVKAMAVKDCDIRSFAKSHNLNLKNFKTAVNNQKYKWTDELS